MKKKEQEINNEDAINIPLVSEEGSKDINNEIIEAKNKEIE